jgi:hypothetical protein
MRLYLKLTFCCTFLCCINAFSQKLTEKEKIVFDDIAYKRMQAGNYEVILKWAIPIRYQILGDAPEYIVKEIDTTFRQLSALTKLDIKKTTDNDEANFLICIGAKDLSLLSKNLLKYVNSFGGHYYRTNKNSEVTRVECLVMPEKYNSKADVRHLLKKNLVKCIGFFKTSGAAPSSLFYNASNGKLKIDEFDSHIISTLYNSEIKPGMEKEQVDKILTGN